jgi:NAD(P)-dependent dehydrogenase (short-subunit alcohol dehydrogenase family)
LDNPQPILKNKVCLITGANSGMGKESCIQLAYMGAHIVMLCRDETKGRIAQDEIIAKSGNDQVDLMIADLSSLKSVREFASAFMAKYDALHVLINNAGVFSWTRSVTVDGFETTFGVDYLAHFLLTNLLICLMKKSAPSRIINISSNIHTYFGINFKDLMSKKKFQSQKAYSNAKGAMVAFTYKLAQQLEGTEITVNALHPGHVKTNMILGGSGKLARFFFSIMPFYDHVNIAAQRIVYLAYAPELQSVTGQYFIKNRPAKSHKSTYDPVVQKQLWDQSALWTKWNL